MDGKNGAIPQEKYQEKYSTNNLRLKYEYKIKLILYYSKFILNN